MYVCHVCEASCMYVCHMYVCTHVHTYVYIIYICMCTNILHGYLRRYTLYHVAFLFQVSIHDSSSSIKLIELSASNFSASHMHSRSLLILSKRWRCTVHLVYTLKDKNKNFENQHFYTCFAYRGG